MQIVVEFWRWFEFRLAIWHSLIEQNARTWLGFILRLWKWGIWLQIFKQDSAIGVKRNVQFEMDIILPWVTIHAYPFNVKREDRYVVKPYWDIRFFNKHYTHVPA